MWIGVRGEAGIGLGWTFVAALREGDLKPMQINGRRQTQVTPVCIGFGSARSSLDDEMASR